MTKYRVVMMIESVDIETREYVEEVVVDAIVNNQRTGDELMGLLRDHYAGEFWTLESEPISSS